MPERIPYFLMMINDSRTDYLCTSVGEAIDAVCEEISGKMQDGESKKLEKFKHAATPRGIRNFLSWADHQGAYEGYTVKDLIHVLRREFTVPQVAQFYTKFIEISSKRTLRRESASKGRASRKPQRGKSTVA